MLQDGDSTYLYGLGRIGEDRSETTLYHLPDALGSVRQLTDSESQILFAQSYEPFGDVLETYGANGSSYGFTGQMVDENGLVYLRARYYDTYLNQFIQSDTIIPDFRNPQSINRYSYVNNNPVNLTDPSGKSPYFPEAERNERDLTWWLYKELTENANSYYIHRINELLTGSITHIGTSLTDGYRGYAAFNYLVKDKAKWDFKHNIQIELSGKAIVLHDNSEGYRWYEYSVPGNINFGFVGRAAGIPSIILHAGASYAEMKDPAHLSEDGRIGNPFVGEACCPCPEVLSGKIGEKCRFLLCWYVNPAWIGRGFDDPTDYAAIETGIQLFDQYGVNMSFSQFIQGLTSKGHLLAKPGTIPDWEWSNPRGGWPYSVGRFNGSREAEYEPIIQELLR